MPFKSILALEDGTIFYGNGYGAKTVHVGEVVFNTSMTGYQEIITDPSYKKQIITFTHPHIGNTGINVEDFESEKIHAVLDCGSWVQIQGDGLSSRCLQKELYSTTKTKNQM